MRWVQFSLSTCARQIALIESLVIALCDFSNEEKCNEVEYFEIKFRSDCVSVLFIVNALSEHILVNTEWYGFN